MPITVIVPRTNEEWVKDLLELWDYADNRKSAAVDRWNESWRLYNNQWDFSAKADWQAKSFISKIPMTVELEAYLVRRAMLDATGAEWFRLEGRNTVSRRMAPYLEKLLYYYLDELRFPDQFSPPLKGGLVGSLIVVKPYLSPYTLAPLDEEDRERALAGEEVEREIVEGSAIQIGFPDPYDIWLDPTGRDLFVIEREIMDLPAVMDLVDVGVFDSVEAAKLEAEMGGDRAEDEVYRERRRQHYADIGSPAFRREVRLLHFWGSLPNDKGRWAIKNGHFVVANEKYVLRRPTENPYEHRKKPYIIGSPFRRPFSVYHKGSVEDVLGLAKAMTEIVNLTLDSVLFSAIKAFEVDLDQIEDPQQILDGIYPGKVFTKRGGGQPGRMIQDIEIAGVSREALAIFNLANVEYQNATAATEFISGAASDTPGRTATEVITKQRQGMGIFGEMARNLEGTVLEPMLEMLASLVVEYHEDFLDPRVVDILGPELAAELANISIEERIDRFQPSKMRVRAGGLTELLSRSEEIQRVMGLLQAIGQFGEILPVVFQDMDPAYFFKGLFKKAVRAAGWNVADLIRPPQIPAAGAVPAGPGGAAPPGPTNQPGAAAPPPIAQVQSQIDQIQQVVGGGAVAPSPQGGA